MFLTSYLINFLNFNTYTNKNLLNKNLSFKLKFFLFKFFQNINKKEIYLYFHIFKINFIYSNFLCLFFISKIKLLSPNSNYLKTTNSNIHYFYSKILTNSNNLFQFSYNLLHNSIFFLNKNINSLPKFSFFIKFSISDFFKYLNNNSLNFLNILFLRKNKVFNKGRYSRNRQYYRTGVYWCLYVNIIAVVGIYFWFYRFNMNFGYLWWVLYFFIFSLFFSRSYSLNVFGIKNTFKQIYISFIWFFNLIYSFFTFSIFFKIFK